MKITKSNARNKTLFLVLGLSVAVHLVALVIFGTFKIVESIVREEQTFEAPPIEEVPQQEPEYVVNLEQRNQSSAPPRPNPIVVDSPDVSIPALNIDINVSNASVYGRGSGGLGGGGNIREMAISNINFFGTRASGGNIVIIFDATHSGSNIFNETRDELFKLIEQMRGSSAEYAVIYFGGRVAGHVVGNMNVDPTKADFWFPQGIPSGRWLRGDSRDTDRIIKQLESVDPESEKSKVEFAKDLNAPGAFFVLGTQFWGAINAAFEMSPPPSTIFFMVEPEIAFPDMDKAKKSYEWFQKYGEAKPESTMVQFVIGDELPEDKKVRQALRYMVNQVNGGGLSEDEINRRITTTN